MIERAPWIPSWMVAIAGATLSFFIATALYWGGPRSNWVRPFVIFAASASAGGVLQGFNEATRSRGATVGAIAGTIGLSVQYVGEYAARGLSGETPNVLADLGVRVLIAAPFGALGSLGGQAMRGLARRAGR